MREEQHCIAPNVCLPTRPVHRIVGPITRFLHVEAMSGVVLLIVTVAALLIANSPAAVGFEEFWKIPIGFRLGDMVLVHSLRHWVNDGLMAIFFFVVGLEVKREIVIGELKEARSAALPIAAAIGGMVVPAGVYLLLQPEGSASRGWGIPMATDIAFVVGCLALLGPRIPHGLRIMLLSLAIVDDIGAVLVIAIGYTSELRWLPLGLGMGGIAVSLLLSRAGVRSFILYIPIGMCVWIGFHESGVHATIAGVLLGLITPARPLIGRQVLSRVVEEIGSYLQGEDWRDTRRRYSLILSLRRVARETVSPLERIETALHPWVGFVIMPLFAFANAGVAISLDRLTDLVSLAVIAGLAFGKPLGILLFSFASIRIGLARMPTGVTMRMLFAGGILAGIGFTMSLFIAGLALEGTDMESAKVGILAGSFACAVVGMTLLTRLNSTGSKPASSV